MDTKSNHTRIATSTIPLFSNGTAITDKEINALVGIALEGGKAMTDEERRVLGNTFKRVTRKDCAESGWVAMNSAISKHNIKVPSL
ncbi:hypothetical protein LMH73_024835 [Vibrio splendidus]|nr:hypothetical protein [Vibrio splendidus]MCC4880538.1 hypothetical protein [Vibrio splendidus]